MRWFVVLLLALVIAVAAYILFEDGGDSDAPMASAQGVSLSELVEERGRHIGDTVTVTAEIDEIVNQRLFLLGRRGAPWTRVAVLADEALVAQIPGEPPSDGERAKVTGTVSAVDIRELRADAGAFGAYAERVLRDRPLIRADSVELTQRPSRRQAPADVTAREVRRNPRPHLGELTTIEGKADDVFGEHAFAIDGLLVVSRLESLDAVSRGDYVEVTGPVRRFDETRFESGTGVELPSSLRRFSDEPALHADIVNYAVPPPHRDAGIDPESLR